MKRSEALKSIMKELETHFKLPEGYKHECPTGAHLAGIAHDILYRLENKGLRPPRNDKLDSMGNPYYDWTWELESSTIQDVIQNPTNYSYLTDDNQEYNDASENLIKNLEEIRRQSMIQDNE